MNKLLKNFKKYNYPFNLKNEHQIKGGYMRFDIVKSHSEQIGEICRSLRQNIKIFKQILLNIREEFLARSQIDISKYNDKNNKIEKI